MNEKLEILQCLIENQAFAPSHSALAKELGYNGKMVIYRLSEGKVKDDTINKITEQICNRFGLYEEHLYKIARIFYGVKFFYDKLISEMDTRNPEWIKNLIISLTCNEYDNFSHKFKDEIMQFIADFNRKKEIPPHEMEMLKMEEAAMRDVLENLEPAGYRGGVILIDGKIESIAIGGRLGDDTIVEHVEKANVEYRGLYQLILNEFCKHIASDAKYLNREEDMDIANLRKAKLSYNPVELIEKYIGVIE